MSVVRFVVFGEPVGKGRPRFGGGRAYTPARTKAYEKLIRTEYLSQCEGKKAGSLPVRMTIWAYFEIPKSRKKTSVLDPYVSAPDMDNIAKIVQDALNGVAYDDDRTIYSLNAIKRYDATSRLVVMLRWEDD